MSTNTRLCRLCGKTALTISNLESPAIKQLLTLAPNLVDPADHSLPQSVCIDCFKLAKQINQQLTNILDTQQILKVELKVTPSRPSSVEEIMRRYKNLRVKKVETKVQDDDDQEMVDTFQIVDDIEVLEVPKKVNNATGCSKVHFNKF